MFDKEKAQAWTNIHKANKRIKDVKNMIHSTFGDSQLFGTSRPQINQMHHSVQIEEALSVFLMFNHSLSIQPRLSLKIHRPMSRQRNEGEQAKSEIESHLKRYCQHKEVNLEELKVTMMQIWSKLRVNLLHNLNKFNQLSQLKKSSLNKNT